MFLWKNHGKLAHLLILAPTIFHDYVPLMWPYHLKLLMQIQLMSNLKPTGLTTSLSTFNTSTSRYMIYLIEPVLSTSSAMISIGRHTSSRWVTKFGYIYRRSASLDPTASFTLSNIGHTPSQGCRDNVFKLSIPPFLSLHLVFNVDRLQPYFPPLLDTSNVVEQLTPIEINPDSMEQAITNRIMDPQVKNTRQ